MILIFLNRDCFVNRKPNETADERNFREFIACYKFFNEHLASQGIKIVVLSDNPDFLQGVPEDMRANFVLANGEEYVSTMTKQFSDLEDKLCRIPYKEDESMNKYKDFTYPPHLESNELQNGIKMGKFNQGAYRSFNFFEGFVRIEEDASKPEKKRQGKKKDELTYNEILIQGLDGVNRATDGDIVVIEILPEDKWSVPSGMVVADAPEKEAPLTSDKVVRENEETDADAQEQKDRMEEEEIFAAVAASAEKVQEKQRTGKVVGIIRRKWLPCCGVVRKSLKEGSSFHYFFPDNKKLPKVRIETRNVDRFEGQKIVAQIDQWPVSSRYPVVSSWLF
jgi:exosome complex exonuclease DIS3/RRP44